MSTSSRFHLAIALDGAGWHPAAWRVDGARPGELFEARYWVDQVAEAELGLADFVTLEDSMAVQSNRRGVPDDRTDELRGRLDAVLLACRVAPATSSIGIVPVATTTHTEPFHVSKAIATLDWVSLGRAGVQIRVSGTAVEAAQFGRRQLAARPVAEGGARLVGAMTDLFDEASDFVEVLRRLWDSWEEDAEIRDATTGRFVDRDKLHYIDFEGRWFSVRGPSITPRSPQGQPVVAALAHAEIPYRLAARSADVVFVTPGDADGVSRIEAQVRLAEAGAGRSDRQQVFADLVVFLDDEPGAAAARRTHLDELWGRPWRSDAAIFAGTPGELADLLESWGSVAGSFAGAGPALSGFRLRPATIPHDLRAITRGLVPLLQQRGRYRRTYEEASLRDRLGLGHPVNRYGPSTAASATSVPSGSASATSVPSDSASATSVPSGSASASSVPAGAASATSFSAGSGSPA